MRKRYKKPLSSINRSIRILNNGIKADPKWHGRFFVKNIAFATFDCERNDPKNNSFFVIMRFYDKETCNYIEEMAHINPKFPNYVLNFAYHTYEYLNEFVHFYADEVIENKDYNKISNDYVIKHGHNIKSSVKFTNRRD